MFPTCASICTREAEGSGGRQVSPVARASDPNGEYIRKWVPELRAVPKEHIHEPWTAPASVLAAAGVVIGETYPARAACLQDLKSARARALQAARNARATAPPMDEDSNGYDVIDAPRGSTTWERHAPNRAILLGSNSLCCAPLTWWAGQ